MKRPIEMKVVGIGWIVFGALIVCSTLMAGYMYWAMAAPLPPVGDGLFALVVEYFPLLLVFQLFWGALGLVSAIEFLRFERWARTGLEIATWLTLLVTGTSSSMALATVVSESYDAQFLGVAVMGAVLSAAFYVVPSLFALRSLRSERIRSLFQTPKNR